MGLVFVLIGLLITGVIVDFAIENELVGSPERTFELFGGTFTLGETQLVLAAAVIGALAVAFVFLGLAMARGRTRTFALSRATQPQTGWTCERTNGSVTKRSADRHASSFNRTSFSSASSIGARVNPHFSRTRMDVALCFTANAYNGRVVTMPRNRRNAAVVTPRPQNSLPIQ
jgi:hypothetical protein